MKLIIDIPEEYKEQFIKNKCDDLFNSLATNEFGYVLRKSFETATLETQPCEDCISRQEAISAIQDEYYADAVGIDIVDIVAHLPSVTPKAERWIPCTERLPKDGDTYLVTIEYKGEVIGVDAASYSPVEGYVDKHWDTFNDWKEDEDSCYHASAWMPLPEPHKSESEVEDER